MAKIKEDTTSRLQLGQTCSCVKHKRECMIRSVHPAHLAIDFIAHFWSNCPECEAIASRRHQEHMYQLEDFIGRSPYAAHGGACARDITGMPGGEDI